MAVNKDHEYRWYNEYSARFMSDGYLLKNQTLDDCVDVKVNTAENILKKNGFAKKFKEYVKKGWYSFSTPVWANFGTTRGLPCSCYGSYIEDTCESIAGTAAEVFMMTREGGGTSATFSNLRGRGAPVKNNGTSPGPVHFMSLFDNIMNVVSQAGVRRGSFAAFLDISHPDIMEFLSIRSEGHPIQSLNFGVCVADDWLKSMINGDAAKRKIWAKVLEVRANTGYPYIIFIDTANRNTVDCYKDKGMKITHSNLCTEIFEVDSPDESFVCDLSSMNVVHFDEWKNTDAVELLAYFLDAVMSEFITKAFDIKYMERAVRFAERHRAIGIGQLGYHTYLQQRMIPIESMEAKRHNVTIAKTIKEQAYKASAKMANEYGEPDVCKGYGRRNAVLLAIAPTKSSAFILGQVSEGIEPHRANYYTKDLQRGKYPVKNEELAKVLTKYGRNNDDTWQSILSDGGSVQNLSFLTDHEKNVFKTFKEISPMELVIQTSQRQKYVDQGISFNLMIDPRTSVKEQNALILKAWELEIKSLYYQISVNAAQTFTRSITSCVSCEA